MDRQMTVDKMARTLAEYKGLVWASMPPGDRDKWRAQCDDTLAYLESTAFFGFLPMGGESDE